MQLGIIMDYLLHLNMVEQAKQLKATMESIEYNLQGIPKLHLGNLFVEQKTYSSE